MERARDDSDDGISVDFSDSTGSIAMDIQDEQSA
eukprot:CAMPEP_0117072154 /NCGR_PEP_ID=MMETSP0472-20121206/50766_1 /TAXON_ID=693140 ORGANISM="Tiarina fusus, Strain LIS" /NCGR_SAMPLE_ID=MMETSP0472 /ASSEMBLY_ACC=CAM_ASM_000603 /LENGTH=33 /DNA_ID= /DNA_START= /DNA_END= /DNA_ORIENTATION=